MCLQLEGWNGNRRNNFASIPGGINFKLSPVLEPTTCAAVIPCFNESASITALVAAVRGQFPSVLVVDDGSTDDTAGRARAAGAVVVRHELNLGKGAALKTGLSRALKLGCEWAVTLDGDGQHAPEDLPALLRGASQTGACGITATRTRWPWPRSSRPTAPWWSPWSVTASPPRPGPTRRRWPPCRPRCRCW